MIVGGLREQRCPSTAGSPGGGKADLLDGANDRDGPFLNTGWWTKAALPFSGGVLGDAW